jgi:hypothetical protein
MIAQLHYDRPATALSPSHQYDRPALFFCRLRLSHCNFVTTKEKKQARVLKDIFIFIFKTFLKC